MRIRPSIHRTPVSKTPLRAPRASFGLVLPFPNGERVGVPRIFDRFENWLRMQGSPLAGKVIGESSAVHRAFNFLLLPEHLEIPKLQSMMPVSQVSRETLTEVRAQIEERAQTALLKFVRREGKADATLALRVTIDTVCPTDRSRPKQTKLLYAFSVRIWIGAPTRRESMRAGKAALDRRLTVDFGREIVAHSSDVQTLINFVQSSLQHSLVGNPARVLALPYGNVLLCNVLPGTFGIEAKFASSSANGATLVHARETFQKKTARMMRDLQSALWRALPALDVVCSVVGNIEEKPGEKGHRLSHFTLILFVGLRNSYNLKLQEQLLIAGQKYAGPLYALDAATHLHLVYPPVEE